MSISVQTLKATLAAGLLATTLLTSCKKEEKGNKPNTEASEKDFQLAFASGSGSISGTYMQGVADVSTGLISFEGAGALLSTARTSRIFPSKDGKYVYSLTYTQGTVDKWEYKGGSDYIKVATIDAGVPLEETGIRFFGLNDEVASLHHVTSTAVYDGTTYKGHDIKVTIGILDLASMSLQPNFNTNINVALPGTFKDEGYNITRIDCPVLSNGKLYYGAAVSKFDEATGTNKATDRAFTLVVDYPSLTNATAIETQLAVGATNGYRTPTQQVNEAGEIYQLVSANNKTSIVKIVNGQYHPSYKYSLDGLLGKSTGSNGFFYAGNGIAFIPYEDKSKPQIQIGVNPQGEPTYSSAWGIARMDLLNNTVVDLEVPDGLWLQQWQNSVVKNGKFYIALSPVGAAGHIYSFDVNSTDKKGTKGAETVSGADQYFIGIY